ncbi:MAG: hypothetical protein P4M01_03880 [Acidobacteriota bacterium]|nr:hypothetical protein [Acidobacteriota bacterium]
MTARIAWFDRDSQQIKNFASAVSIHSHTSRSRESLEFVQRTFDNHPVLRRFLSKRAGEAQRSGIPLDLKRGYWTPPLCPRSAYEVEKNQIEQKLGLRAMVSLSDHDCIAAPMLLQMVPALQTPISLEWTVPFQRAKFHLGVHNLPAAEAHRWLAELQACTAEPSTGRVCDLLRTLNALPGILVVFNHPLWNLYGLPVAEFQQQLEDFLALNNGVLHAFELNGLRRWEENARTIALARRWQQIVISGGDRHGAEPNANLNLTNASCFDEWVREIRVERRSHLLFMPQYNDPLEARCYQTFLDAIRYYPEHSDGACQWDQRTFHPGGDGQVHPLSDLWRRVPPFLQIILGVARLAESTPLLSTVRHYGARPVDRLPGLTGNGEAACD